jgi:Asp-tRNA(Asn)/Glu-tRNA(Gln) amidotransferase C subunit
MNERAIASMDEAELQGIRAESEHKATKEHVARLLTEIYRLKSLVRTYEKVDEARHKTYWLNVDDLRKDTDGKKE